MKRLFTPPVDVGLDLQRNHPGLIFLDQIYDLNVLAEGALCVVIFCSPWQTSSSRSFLRAALRRLRSWRPSGRLPGLMSAMAMSILRDFSGGEGVDAAA